LGPFKALILQGFPPLDVCLYLILKMGGNWEWVWVYPGVGSLAGQGAKFEKG